MRRQFAQIKIGFGCRLDPEIEQAFGDLTRPNSWELRPRPVGICESNALTFRSRRLLRSAGPADITVMQRPRAEIRMLCADMVEVCWKEPAGRKRKSTALLEDISPSGMCLQFEIPLSIGTHVDVHCPGDKLAGIVRYCVYREIGYFVGIELEPSSKWSRQQFEPQHLLDLQELVLRSAGRASGTIQ